MQREVAVGFLKEITAEISPDKLNITRNPQSGGYSVHITDKQGKESIRAAAKKWNLIVEEEKDELIISKPL